MAVVGFFLTLAYAMWFAWGRVEGKVKIAEDKADMVQRELAAHKLHVAETYSTKAGMQEQTAAIMRAIESVANRIDVLTERLDRAFERQPRTRQ